MEDLINLTDAARILQVHPNTVRAWITKGLLPPPVVIHRSCHRYRRADIEALAADLEEVDGNGEGVNHD